MAAQLDDLRSRLAAAEQELASRSREATDAITTARETSGELAAETARRKGIEGRIATLEAELAEAESRRKRSEEAFRSLTSERDTLQQRVQLATDHREALKAAEFEISRLKAEAPLMQKRVDDAHARLDPVLRELEETKSRLAQLAADRNALATDKSSLEQSHSRLASLEAENARLRQRTTELEAETEKLQTALSGSQSALAAARTAAAAAASENASLVRRLEDALKDKPVIVSGRKILTSPKQQ
jgi:chromosome segregation ATPase